MEDNACAKQLDLLCAYEQSLHHAPSMDNYYLSIKCKEIAEVMGLWIKCLLHKHKDRSSRSLETIFEPGKLYAIILIVVRRKQKGGMPGQAS